MNITVTGGTGLVGRRLVKRLRAEGHSVHLLLRQAKTGLEPGVEYSVWDVTEGGLPVETLAEADAVIHLAGENIAQRWTPTAKQKIRASRVKGAEQIVQALAGLPHRPAALISSSAVGYYGSRGGEILTESSAPGTGFLPELCIAWEDAAGMAGAMGVRTVSLRTGVVLSPEGGVLAKVLPVFRWGAGGRLGSGDQWMSWIHIDDLVRLILFALERADLRGPINATAPNPVTNAEFTDTLADVLRRPAFVPVPAFALEVLFGEMAEVLLGGQRVLPRAAEAAGFQFEYPDLKTALRQLLA